MNLPKLSLDWLTPELIKNLIECFRQIGDADKQNVKRGRDIEMGAGRIILTSAGGVRVAIETDDTGNLTGTVL
jgi:hypothetical protein